MGEYLDDDKVFLKLDDGSIHCVEEKALEILLRDNILFSNEREFLNPDGTKGGSTVILYVNCNDVFAWACADAEDLPHDEIGNLYKMHKANKRWGATIWCILRRKQKPQKPMEDLMKKDGVWTEGLEKLNENTQDEETQALFAHYTQTERDKK